MPKAKGRRKGSRNKGYFYPAGRGWCFKAGTKFVPLVYDNGDRMRDRSTPIDDVKAAYKKAQAAEPVSATNSAAPDIESTPLGRAALFRYGTDMGYKLTDKQFRARMRRADEDIRPNLDFVSAAPRYPATSKPRVAATSS
jgi:hypothetical protein